MQSRIYKFAFLFALGFAVLSGCGPAADTASLKVYCAAVMRKPMEVLAQKYHEKTGTLVELQFGGSNTLLSQASISGAGDLYLAADQSYIDAAVEKHLVDEVYPIASITPVIITSKQSGATVDSITYLVSGNPRIVLPNPDTAAIGRVAKQALEERGIWEEVSHRVQTNGVFKPTVGDVAGDVALGSADVGIVWDTIGKQMDTLSSFHLPELEPWKSTISIAVLKSTSNRERAIDFATFVANSPEATQEYARLGFQQENTSNGESSHD